MLISLTFTDPIPDNEPENPFAGATGLIQTYDWLPYSHQRIKQLFHDEYGITLDCIHPGYKGGRYPGYVNRYCLRWIDTGEIINPSVKLDWLRYFLARHGHPLHDNGPKRNPKCEAFLEAVRQQNEQKHYI